MGVVSHVQQQSATDTRLSFFRYSMKVPDDLNLSCVRLKPLEKLHQTHRCYTIKEEQLAPQSLFEGK
jgi:hypothetical protein